MTRLPRFLISTAAAIVVGALALSTPAAAQGRSEKAHGAPPGHLKNRRVTSTEAVGVTREVLVAHGYRVVRVERMGLTRVVYYRRGNRGHGRGLGPMEKMIIRPSGERVVFESAPPKVLIDINVRLGL